MNAEMLTLRFVRPPLEHPLKIGSNGETTTTKSSWRKCHGLRLEMPALRREELWSPQNLRKRVGSLLGSHPSQIIYVISGSTVMTDW